MKLRHWVFWPPFLFLTGAVALSLWDNALFAKANGAVNQWILSNFSMGFALSGLFALFVCALAYITPFGRTTFGGVGAKRLLNPWDWCAVAIGVNTAVGILFWAAAEPIYHFTQPPISLGLAAYSPEARTFALSTLYMHWSFTPCALYALPGLAFAHGFYNLRQPFSLSACLAPLTGKTSPRAGAVMDAIALFSLVTGMAASLDTGILTLAGGLEHFAGVKSNPTLWIALGLGIVGAFVLSSISGLDRGIKWLSQLNLKLFFLFLAVAVAFGPAAKMFGWGSQGLGEYASTFFPRSLFLEFASTDPWPRAWTVFYWAVWLAWAPITALFLGKIARGYTVRQFILVNVVLPAVFAIAWMTIFGVSALEIEGTTRQMSATLAASGPESLVYRLLAQYPFAAVLIPIFLITVFVSYVTSADSNTTVMAGLCSTGISCDSAEPPTALKLLWGVILGAVALVMLCLSGVDGIRSLSYLGGLPALFFLYGCGGALLSGILSAKHVTRSSHSSVSDGIAEPEPV